MANVGSLGSAPQQPPPPSDQSAPLSWEGDKMFNIYIYDYCHKRGFRKTAQQLMSEADIAQDAKPPINARQGLLFEWWSVFWVLFTAKASGNGSDDAILYTQHQGNLAGARQRHPPQTTIPQGISQPPPPPQQHLQPGRLVNGMPPNQIPNRQFMPNGNMVNGMGPQGSMQPGNPNQFPNAAPHLNGMPPSTPGPPPNQPQNFNQMMSNGHRPPMPQQRALMNSGAPPYSPPSMDGGPQNALMNQVPTPQGQQPGMSTGPSPRMMNRGAMLPPSGAQGMHPAPHQMPSAPYQQQMGRPPSRSATPGSAAGMMTQPSPSLNHRQVPAMGGPVLVLADQALGVEIRQLQQSMPGLIPQIKHDAGILPDKDLTQLTTEEKQRLVTLVRQRQARNNPNNNNPKQNPMPSAGPSSQTMQPPRSARTLKRGSTSPDEDGTGSSPPDKKKPRRSPQEQPPITPMAYPPMTQQTPQQSGAPPTPQPSPMNNSGGMQQPPRPPSMNGLPNGFQQPMQMPMNAMPMNMNQPMPPQMPGMSGGINNMNQTGMMGNPQMMNRPDAHTHYRQSLTHLHARNMPQQNPMPGSAGSPPGDPNFNGNQPGPGNQQQQFSNRGGPMPGPPPQKIMAMLPPPSPGLNKDNKQDVKPEGSPNTQQGHTPQPANNGPESSSLGPGTNPLSQSQNMAPSPSLLGTPINGMSGNDIFSPDFMSTLTDDFDPNMFRTEGDINFERDFGQWFNPDDVPPIDMK